MPPSRWQKAINTLHWLPSYCWQRLVKPAPQGEVIHLIFALADHFEPATVSGYGGQLADLGTQQRRLERWCREYPVLVQPWPDSDGQTFRHTYFYPAEQYEPGFIQGLAEHCRAGWGETEIHLHHGQQRPANREDTRRVLTEFRDALAKEGCLSRLDGDTLPRYAFVHGNFALANSRSGQFCGVDDEMQILAETGCYADFTLPSAPLESQISKINSLYECGLPLDHKAPHRKGHDLRRGQSPRFPLLVQGPLAPRLRPRFRFIALENGDLTTKNPPSLERIELWQRVAIGVQGCPSWVFIKLHCHGMDSKDEAAMLGPIMVQFLRELAAMRQSDKRVRHHFVTAREMVNIALAACDGHCDDPNAYRSYRLRPITSAL